jgi:guanosine-3',5'-bis(diphosphate) 3'-pyrophosphohydrolase
MTAREFAVTAHGAQLYGVWPYVVHLDEVADILKPYGEHAQMIGYLHDVLEDTDATVTQISEKFNPFVAHCVELLTDAEGETRKERKAKTYSRLALVVGDAELALIVKTADRLANVRACIRDRNHRLLKIYRDEHPVFKVSVFRSKLCDSLWLELNTAIDG